MQLAVVLVRNHQSLLQVTTIAQVDRPFQIERYNSTCFIISREVTLMVFNMETGELTDLFTLARGYTFSGWLYPMLS